MNRRQRIGVVSILIGLVLLVVLFVASAVSGGQNDSGSAGEPVEDARAAAVAAYLALGTVGPPYPLDDVLLERVGDRFTSSYRSRTLPGQLRAGREALYRRVHAPATSTSVARRTFVVNAAAEEQSNEVVVVRVWGGSIDTNGTTSGPYRPEVGWSTTLLTMRRTRNAWLVDDVSATPGPVPANTTQPPSAAADVIDAIGNENFE